MYCGPVILPKSSKKYRSSNNFCNQRNKWILFEQSKETKEEMDLIEPFQLQFIFSHSSSNLKKLKIF